LGISIRRVIEPMVRDLRQMDMLHDVIVTGTSRDHGRAVRPHRQLNH